MDTKYTERNTLNSQFKRALKPDAQGFDEIRLITKPRWKTSGLSGNEWRIAIFYQFFRKGKLICEDFCGHKMEDAVNYLPWKYVCEGDNGKMYFAGEDNICDQEGCSKKATVVYQLKKNFCREGHESIPSIPTIRLFCDEHSKRGDCGLEDADANYDILTRE